MPATKLDRWLYESLSKLQSKIASGRTVAKYFTAVRMTNEETSQKADRSKKYVT